MSALQINVSRLLNKTILSPEALDKVVEISLRRSCERIAKRARQDHPTWKNRTGSLERAIMFQVQKKKRKGYVFIRKSRLAKNSKGQLVPYHEYLRFGTGLYGKHKSYIYPRREKVLVWYDRTGRKFVRRRTKGIRGDDWLARARARETRYISKIFREVLEEYYGAGHVR